MLKRLPIFLLFLFFFTAAGAQTHSDSVKQMLVDTISKSPKADKTKRPVVDTGKHVPADTVIKHVPADTVIRHAPADTVIKHIPVDSTTKHSPAKGVVKKILVDTLVHSPLKTLSDKKYNAYLRG